MPCHRIYGEKEDPVRLQGVGAMQQTAKLPKLVPHTLTLGPCLPVYMARYENARSGLLTIMTDIPSFPSPTHDDG
jgi:hypothetical protein